MRFLLTSAGIKNTSIRDALVDLLGKPIAESSALCIPTAMYGHPWVGPGVKAWEFISGREPRCPMCELGWKSLGVLELTALPSIDEERWVPLVQETDVLLGSGGDALYLCHWMRESGLADLLPSLDETVWVGLSAGSMVMTPQHRAGLRRLEAAHRRRQNARTRRLLDLPARGSRGSAVQHHGQRRTMGGRDPKSGVCDRRSNRHQSDRRHRRRRFRGALEAVCPLTHRSQAESAGTRTDAMTFLASGRNALSWAGPATSSTATNRCCLPP